MMSPGFTTTAHTTEGPFSLLHKKVTGSAVCLLLLLAAGVLIFAPPVRGQQPPSLFSSPALPVAPSPADARQLALAPGERVMDLDVSPTGPNAALLLRTARGGTYVTLWHISTGKRERLWSVPAGLRAQSLAWHPRAGTLFLLGRQANESVIIRLRRTEAGWEPKIIFRDKRPLRRLVASPRPFTKGLDNSQPFYRLFFAVERPDRTFLIASVSEQGKNYYELTWTRKTPAAPEVTPSVPYPVQQIEASSALPMAFHPAGHLFLWEDSKRCFQVAHYQISNWGKSVPLLGGTLCGGSVTPTPNGIGLLRWRAGMRGVELYLPGGKQPTPQAQDYTFLGTPSSVPDGRGVVGVVRTGETVSVDYVPIDMPLSNVRNAWMFTQTPHELALFGKHGGLFRPQTKDYQQLYQLYDSEAYSCGGYDASTPTRPYFVTTDLFWENFAAAYDGLFILLERRQAIPAFWRFVGGANRELEKAAPHSGWAGVFRVLAHVESGHATNDPEAQRILAASGTESSSILRHAFDYGELKPRGHYTASEKEKRYFKAFRYLTAVARDATWAKQHPAGKLRVLPGPVQDQARQWIHTYLYFIAPPRSPLLWSGLPASKPAYVRHSLSAPSIFPLSWGFDNETLLSTVFHAGWPKEEQITGPGGPRLMPSGLDVAAALGNPLARTLLAGEIRKFPPLARTLDDLSVRFKLAGTHPANDLYDRWIEALATDWAAEAAEPGANTEDIRPVKRLQTGLASWATLRHATVLVNERTAAECGEGGFEWILLAPPRGYVERAPKTFEAIAGLFDAAANAVRGSPALAGGNLPNEEGGVLALREGLRRRLGEAAAKSRLFAKIARKELQGIPLSAHDYDEILYVNRTAEYEFLIFNSLANPDFALSNPDPMPKVADVAGNAETGYLEAGVGEPLEWDEIVPYYGRREIVKGSVYSYFEFTSQEPMDDQEWRKRLPTMHHPSWVAPFVSNSVLSCPAKNPY
jgi:Protein of unknown function (DUF3160)